MKTRAKQKFYENQYKKGETAGPGWYQVLKKFTKTREEVVVDYLKHHHRKKKVLIDLGCGEGFLLRELASQYDQLIGTDIARNRIKLARQASKKNKNISYRIVDLDEPLPFAKQSASAVTCVGVMEYVFDPYSFIREVKKIMKKGGVLALSVPNLAYLPERVKLLFGVLPSWPDAPGWQGGRLHAFTFKSLIDFLEENGFVIVEKQAVGFLQPLRNWWPELLSGDCCFIVRKK